MNADKKKFAAACWTKGSEAMSKENWDYAIEMFSRSVALVPDNLMYRQALRGVEYKKYNDNKTGARMAGMKLMKIRSKIKKSKGKEDWAAVDRDAEEGLTINPWDAGLNADLGEACHHLGYGEIAVFAYSRAVETEPNSKDYNRALAGVLEDRGEFLQAIKVWERIRKLDPLDGDARSKVTQLQAETVMDKGNYGNRDTDGGAPLGKVSAADADAPGMSEEADLQRAIRKDPGSKENYLKLADYYYREGRLEESMTQYKQALDVSGGDPNIRETIEDIELQMLRQNLALAREAANQNPQDEAAKKNREALTRELYKREVAIFEARVERYPADLRYKFELAQRLMKFQRFSDAIKLLQQTVKDNRLAKEAYVSLGECFISEKKPQLAIRQLENAAKDINQLEAPELFKKCHYYLGRLKADAGDKAAAENHYNEVLAVDYDYRDTLTRLESLAGA